MNVWTDKHVSLKHLLQLTYALVRLDIGHFTASTTETKLSFNITEDLWRRLTSLISGVFSQLLYGPL